LYVERKSNEELLHACQQNLLSMTPPMHYRITCFSVKTDSLQN
jgi:hypothetical protein